MKKIGVIIILIFCLSIFLVSCKKETDYKEARKTLTEIVYDVCINKDMDLKNEYITTKKETKVTRDKHILFGYESFYVYESFTFTISFDFKFAPYFDNEPEDEINVIVALLIFNATLGAFFSPRQVYETMIIFEYNGQKIGFVGDGSSYANKSDDILAKYNSSEDENSLRYDFSSAFFIANGSVIKYYEKTDIIYYIRYFEDADENKSLEVEFGVCFSENLEFKSYSIEETTKMNSEIAYDFINSCVIEKSPLMR